MLKDSFRKLMVYVGLTEDDYDDLGRGAERPFVDNTPHDAYESQWAPPAQQPVAPVVARTPSVSVLDNGYAPSAAARPMMRPATPSSSVRPITTLAHDGDLEVLVPRSYEDSKRIGDHLKARRALVVNLVMADADLSRRIIDFSSGVVYTLAGRIQRVAPQVYLLTPQNVRVSPESIDRLRQQNFRSFEG